MSVFSHSKDLYFTYLVVHICRFSKESLPLAFWNTSKTTSSLNYSACQIRPFSYVFGFWIGVGASHITDSYFPVLFHFIPSWFAWDCTYVWFCSFSDVHVWFPWVLYVVCWVVILVSETEKMGTTDRCFLVVFFLSDLEEFNFDFLVLKA